MQCNAGEGLLRSGQSRAAGEQLPSSEAALTSATEAAPLVLCFPTAQRGHLALLLTKTLKRPRWALAFRRRSGATALGTAAGA